jgi:hypothetical protein
MPSVDRLGLLVDVAVAYDRVSTRYFNVADSLAAITNLVHEGQADLTAKGYEVAFVESPFVGGFKNAHNYFPVAVGRKDKPSSRMPPFMTTPDLDADPAYRDALLCACRDVLRAVENRGRMPTDVLVSSEATRLALRSIAAKKNIRYLFVIQGDGTIVSGGKQLGQEVLTGILSTVITFGAVTVSAHNISFLDSYVSLIDLQNAEVVWSNSLRLREFNAANANHYKARWAHNVLYWLPPRGQLDPRSNDK